MGRLTRYRYSLRKAAARPKIHSSSPARFLHKKLHANFVLKGLNRDKLPESQESRGIQITKRTNFTGLQNSQSADL